MSDRLKKGPARRLSLRGGRVDMSHGGGGRAMVQLIEEIFLKHLDNPLLRQGNDFAVMDIPPGRLVMSTDGHVVSPLFFPGGDIGELAVNGTVNDVAMSGARVLHLSASFIIEEGFPLADLDRIVASMAQAAERAGVTIATGDTKVVERGKGDGVFISTTGIGVLPEGVRISGERAAPGDVVIVNGGIGEHGVAIMASREGLGFETDILSDTAALNGLVEEMVKAVPDIHVLRDPTRGGLAATLNEIAHQAGVGIRLDEARIPLRPEVAGACELLGLDPLNVACEGRLIAICAAADAERLLEAMRAHPRGREAAVIGEVVEDPDCFVTRRTGMGGERVVDWIAGEQLPRIC